MTTDASTFTRYLTSYWHQDFDIHGDTIEEVTDVYLDDTRGENADALLAEIEQILRIDDDEALRDLAFEQTHASIDPEGFGMTPRQWLEALRNHLRTTQRCAPPPAPRATRTHA